MNIKVIQDGQWYRFTCPHCNIDVEVNKKQVNCQIFRCGILKSNGKQIGPHTKKQECDRLFQNNLIHGCSKPFRYIRHPDGDYVEKCGYI